MPFTGTLNKLTFGQVTEVLKIIIFFFSVFSREVGVILASSKHPQRFDVSAFMLHPEHLHEWLCLGLVQQNPSASPPRGLSVINPGLQQPLWGHEMVAGNEGGRTSHWDEVSGVWELLTKKRKLNERKREGYKQIRNKDIT